MEPLPGALIMQGSEQSSLIVHLFYWSDSGILLSSNNNNNDHLTAFDPGQPGYAGTRRKHSPTHTHPDHRASFITFLHLQWSMASSLFNLRA